MEQNPTDDELRSYLLGELPEPQADALEERILHDDELFDLVESLEADLLDAAIRGELAPAERERVLRRLASSPEGRERLALVRSLNAVAKKNRPPVVVPFHPRPKPVLRWVATLAAAALFATVGYYWWPTHNDRGGDVAPPPIVDTDSTPATPVGPVPPPVTTPTIAEDPGVPEPSPAPGHRDAGVPTMKRPEPVKAVLALALTTLRGDGEETKQLHLEANTEVAEIQIDLEGLEDAGPFHASVHDKDRKLIWEEDGLKPQKLDWGTALVLDVPAQRLAPGLYEVAVTSSADPEEMTQEFSVVRAGV